MNKVWIIIVVAALVAAGIYAFRADDSSEFGKGVPANAEITDIRQILDHGKDWQGKEVTIRGEMTQKCPTTGCWFYLKDETGEVRVDTAPSGFTITEIPMGKTITVYGKVAVTENGDTELVATGVKS